MSTANRWLTLAIMVMALALLVPGVTQPVLTLSGTIERADLVDMGIDTLLSDNEDPRARQMVMSIARMLGLTGLDGELPVYHTSRSILQAVHELAARGNLPVAMLIVLFSVILPTCKLLVQALTLFAPWRWRQALHSVTQAASKWSMADVFVIALLVAYMAGQASGEMGGMLKMSAQLEVGFWYFLGYCLFSIASTALVREQADLTAPQPVQA
jgi:hypothetical protein